MLFSPPIMLLSTSQEMYRLCRKKCPLCPYATAKKFNIGDSERLVQVIFYMLLGFDSIVSTTRRVSRDLTLLREIKRPRQACSIMK